MVNFKRCPDSSGTTAAMAGAAGQPEWFDKFMSNAARTFGIAARKTWHPGDMATAFDQRGHFGFACFVRMETGSKSVESSIGRGKPADMDPV